MRTRCFHDVALAILGQHTGCEKAEDMRRSHDQMCAVHGGWVAEVLQEIADPTVRTAAGMMLGSQRSEVVSVDPILQSPQRRYDHLPCAVFRTPRARRYASSY